MNPSYIISRAIAVILLIIVGLYGFSYFKKRGRQNEIVGELKSLCSESSFYGQFSAVEAQSTLLKAVGLVAEAKNAGMEPDEVIERALGLQKGMFAMSDEKDGETPRQMLIRKTLRANYENLRKLGYVTDYETVKILKNGELPPIGSGLRTGKRAEVLPIIGENLSPGMSRVIANLEIRPSDAPRAEMTDVEIAAAMNLVTDLNSAEVIDNSARTRIMTILEQKSKNK